ncbi:hypothetical protein SAMN05444672_10334 [Bacillus sp. OK838]|nr:hypothetical protein SAMN05444672_10334 [Bacillus sp. OK838]
MFRNINASLAYYFESSIYLNTIKLLQVEQSGFHIQDSILDKSLFYSWDNILEGVSLNSWYEENKKIINNNNSDTYHFWNDILNEVEAKDFEKGNNKLKTLLRKGFIIEDYAEFFLWYEPFNWGYYETKVKDLMIDTVKITLNNSPSALFTILHKHIENDDTFTSWNMVTISLQGINKENVEDYIQRAIFLLGFFNPSYYKNEWPHVEMFLGEDYGYTDEDLIFDPLEMDLISNHFTNINYPDAITFYNTGTRIPDEIGVIYFYKVIEHFFLLPRKQQFQKLIKDNRDDIDLLFVEFVKIFKKYNLNELDNLRYLIDFLHDDINDLIDEAFNFGLIDTKTSNKFASELYTYRNSITHGKNDINFELTTPTVFSDFSQTGTWYTIIKKFSFICINKFCFTKTLREKIRKKEGD